MAPSKNKTSTRRSSCKAMKQQLAVPDNGKQMEEEPEIELDKITG